MDNLVVEDQDAINVFDRGYVDYDKFDEFCLKGIRFVTRLKGNAIIEGKHKRTVPLCPELEAISPYGQIVEVNGQKMHVYPMGIGEKTIVLLPGFGVALPSADFGPLMRELSKEYTVVCIEYFGIGFSDRQINHGQMKTIRRKSELHYPWPASLMLPEKNSSG